MTPTTYLLGLFATVLALVVVIELLRRRRLRERHAIWWLIAGLVALLLGVFPSILVFAAELIGVEVPTNLAFFLGITILFLVSLQHSAEVTVLENKSRTLAEQSAILELRVRELESRRSGTDMR